MNHLTEEQLILHHYGEAENAPEVAEHLRGCAVCRGQYEALHRTLSLVTAAPAPERSVDYGGEVWRRLRPELREEPRFQWRRYLRFPPLADWSRWAWVPLAAMALCVAFLAGRLWPAPSLAARGLSAEVRRQILLREIGEHLERSQVALIELLNTKTNGMVDLSMEQDLARKLVAANRLYRQTAAKAGDARMVAVLEDLERALIEIAHAASPISSTELANLRQRVDTDGLLFKVKAVDAQLRLKERDEARARAAKPS